MKCPMCGGSRHIPPPPNEGNTTGTPCPCCAYAERLAREAIFEYTTPGTIARRMTRQEQVDHSIATARVWLERVPWPPGLAVATATGKCPDCGKEL